MGYSEIIGLKSEDEEDYKWLAPASIQLGKGKFAWRAVHHSVFPFLR